MYEKLKEIRQIALDAISNIKAAASDAMARVRAHADALPPQKRQRIVKAVKYAGIAALCVGVFVYWNSRNDLSPSKEIQ